MKRRKRDIVYLYISAAAVFFCGGVSLCIEENTNTAGIIEQKKYEPVRSVTYENAVKKTKAHSHDLKIADFNILISKQAVIGSRADYFPKLTLSAGTEYTKNFRDNRDTSVISIGGNFINPYTRFQTVTGITLTYNLFDFGTRKNLVSAAEEDVKIKEIEEKIRFQDLVLNVTDAYAQVLMIQEQLRVYKDILELQWENIAKSKRLYNARMISLMDFTASKNELSRTKTKISEAEALREEALARLSFYTGEEYDIQKLKAEKFVQENDFDPYKPAPLLNCLVMHLYNTKLRQKEFEINAAKSKYYPKVTLYSQYYLYGSNHSSFPDSLKDIRSSNLSAGGVLNMPVFDGFKNSSDIKIKRLELEQLMEEKRKALDEHKTKISVMRSNLRHLTARINESRMIERELKQQAAAKDRLEQYSMITPMEKNNAKIELLEQNIETIKNETAAQALIKAIELLSREY